MVGVSAARDYVILQESCVRYCETLSTQSDLATDSPLVRELNGNSFHRLVWTKLFAGDFPISNSIEFAIWDEPLICPWVCETCWEAGCGSYEYRLLTIFRLNEFLLWMPPTDADLDVNARDRFDQRLFHFNQNELLTPVTAWSELRERFSTLPSPERFPPPRRRDIINLWFNSMPDGITAESPERLDDLFRNRVIASDPCEISEARQQIETLLAWLNLAPNAPVEGHFVNVQEFDGVLATLFFEGPPFHEWKALAVKPRLGLVFDNDWVLPLDEVAT